MAGPPRSHIRLLPWISGCLLLAVVAGFVVGYLILDGTSHDVPIAAPSLKPLLESKPYAKESYASRLLASSKNRHVWGLDPKEIEWAKANYLEIMDRDFQVTPFAGGGLKVASVRPGSLGALRGLKPGHVVRTLDDLKRLMNTPGSERTPTEPPRNPGYEIDRILPGSIMEAQGLKPGDIVLSINNDPIYPDSNIQNTLELHTKREGHILRIVVERAGELFFFEWDSRKR